MSSKALEFSTFLLQNEQKEALSRASLRPIRGGNNTDQPIDSCAVSIPVAHLEVWIAEYLIDCEGRDQSTVTLQGKRDAFQKLLWFLAAKGHTECGLPQLRRFFVYLRNGHLEPGGRWGNRQLTKPLSRRGVEYYYVYLQTLFRWFVSEGLVCE